MNILEIFGDKLREKISNNDQNASELLIELATFFYKIDNRVSLQEQEYMESLVAGLEWKSSTSIESYQTACIARVNKIIDAPENEISNYLSHVMESLAKVGGVEEAQILAKEISDADGEVADEEVKYLEIVMAFK